MGLDSSSWCGHGCKRRKIMVIQKSFNVPPMKSEIATLINTSRSPRYGRPTGKHSQIQICRRYAQPPRFESLAIRRHASQSRRYIQAKFADPSYTEQCSSTTGPELEVSSMKSCFPNHQETENLQTGATTIREHTALQPPAVLLEDNG